MTKTVQLYVNGSKNNAIIISENIRKALILNGYSISDDNPDIVIGFGGDGTLLNFLSDKNYSTTSNYIGVNCGTLGFMQDFDVLDVNDFVKNIPNYIEQKLYFISLRVITDNDILSFKALNEFYLLNNMDKSFRVHIKVNDEFLEDYVGTGMLFSTPTGSTARNLSSIGSIISPGIEAIQMTPSEAIVNSKMRCLPKSICFPRDTTISLTPLNQDEIKILADGKNLFEGTFKKIDISYSNNFIVKLTDLNNNFISKIRKKLIL